MGVTEQARPESEGDPIVEVEDITVSFPMERGTSNVLNSVDMDIERNEILGIVGESGSGKSMFASALLDAVVDPGEVSGNITFNPEDGDPIDRAVADLIESLETGEEPLVSARRTLSTMELIFGTFQSARKRGRVDFPLDVGDNPLESMVERGDLVPDADQ